MIAEQMCVTLMQRFKITETSNVIDYKYVWNKLKDEFTMQDVEDASTACNCKTAARQIVYKWRSKELITKTSPKTFKKNMK